MGGRVEAGGGWGVRVCVENEGIYANKPGTTKEDTDEFPESGFHGSGLKVSVEPLNPESEKPT